MKELLVLVELPAFALNQADSLKVLVMRKDRWLSLGRCAPRPDVIAVPALGQLLLVDIERERHHRRVRNERHRQEYLARTHLVGAVTSCQNGLAEALCEGSKRRRHLADVPAVVP